MLTASQPPDAPSALRVGLSAGKSLLGGLMLGALLALVLGCGAAVFYFSRLMADPGQGIHASAHTGIYGAVISLLMSPPLLVAVVLIFIIPAIQQVVRVDLRTVVLEVPAQDVISRDNVSVKVNAVIYLRVVDAEKAVIQVVNYLEATSQLAQTMLRSVLGKHQLDEMLAERESLNLDIQQALDAQTDTWGIKVSNVEIKQVDLTESMIRAIARQAEADEAAREAGNGILKLAVAERGFAVGEGGGSGGTLCGARDQFR